MCNVFRIILLLKAIFCLSSCDNTPPRTVVVHAGRFLRGLGSPALGPTRITLHDGIIAAIDAESDTPVAADAAVIQAAHLTVMPGLVAVYATGLTTQILQAPRTMRGLLAAGVTTVADLGASLPYSVGVRRYVGTARHRGPRVFVAGPTLHTRVPALTQPGNNTCVDSDAVHCIETPDEARQTVRAYVDAGVDWISVAMPDDVSATACTVIAEAHHQHLHSVARVARRAAAVQALRCDADVLAVDDNMLDAQNVSKVLADGRVILPMQPPPDARRLLSAGVPLGFVTDRYPAQTLRRWTQQGVAPAAALALATHGSAQALHLHEALGQLSVGFRADLIGVAGEPDIDVDAMARVRWVFIDGIEQDLNDGPWYQALLLAWEVGRARLWH